jgi:hypothetical protein
MNLRLTKLPDKLMTLGDYAFGWCEYVTFSAFPNGLQTIPTQAFAGCKRA